MTAAQSELIGPHAATPRAVNSGHAASYAVFTFFLCVALFPTARAMVSAWLTSSSFHHGVLVGPISLFLIIQTRPAFPPNAWPPALFAIIGCLGVWIVGHAASVNLIEQFAFVSLLIGGVALVYGKKRTHEWAFPLAFLYFMIPFGGSLVPLLQSVAAQGVISLLRMTGVAAGLDGVTITVAAQRFAIAEACAGLNFLIVALMIASLFGYLAFSTLRKKLLFVAFAVLFALIANILRAYAVILAATLTDGAMAIGADHIVFGWVFYGVLIFILVAVGEVYADRQKWDADKTPERRAVSIPAARVDRRHLIAVLALVTATSAYGRFVVDRGPEIQAPGYLPLLSASGWRPLAPSAEWSAKLDHADRLLHARYSSGPHKVFVNAGFFTHERPGVEIAGGDTQSYDETTWRRIAARRAPFFAFGERHDFTIETLEGPDGARLDAVMIYWTANEILENPATVKWRLARARLFGRQPRGGVFVVAAPSRDNNDSQYALAAFLGALEPLSDWLARVDTSSAH